MHSLIKTAFSRMGLEIRRTRSGTSRVPSDPYLAQKALMLTGSQPQQVIFDVGAHHGETAAAFLRVLPEAHVHCFEPLPESASKLRQRFADNPRVTINEVAASDASSRKTLFVNTNDATHSLLPRDSGHRRYYHSRAGAKSRQMVQAVSLDDYATANQIEHVDILKLDIQGGELMALKGAADLLGRQGIDQIYSEVFFTPHYQDAPLMHDIWACLASFGYTLFDIYNPFHASNGQLRFADVLFVSPRIRSEIIDQFPPEP